MLGVIVFVAASSTLAYSLAREVPKQKTPPRSTTTSAPTPKPIPWYCKPFANPTPQPTRASGQNDTKFSNPTLQKLTPIQAPTFVKAVPPTKQFPQPQNSNTHTDHTSAAHKTKKQPDQNQSSGTQQTTQTVGTPGYTTPATPDNAGGGTAGYKDDGSGYTNTVASGAPGAPSTMTGGVPGGAVLPTASQGIIDNTSVTTLLTTPGTNCPPGYYADYADLVNQCTQLLQEKLDGTLNVQAAADKLPACTQIIKAELWSAKINKKLCDAFKTQLIACVGKKVGDPGCPSFVDILKAAGVAAADYGKTVTDLIKYCSVVYQ